MADKFAEVLAKMQQLHDSKAADYTGTRADNLDASAAWGIPAWVGCLIRAEDKLARLKTFVERGHLLNESVEDSLIDNAVYAVLAVVKYWEEIEAR